MAYVETSLVRLAAIPVDSSTVICAYLYATADAAAVVETAGYFNSARTRLSKGDMIDAAMVVGGTPVSKRYVVTASPSTGNVTIAVQATAPG